MKIYITQSRYDASIIELEVAKETAKMYILKKESEKDVVGDRARVWFNSRVYKNDPNVFISLAKAKSYLAKRLVAKITYRQQQIDEMQQVLKELEEIE